MPTLILHVGSPWSEDSNSLAKLLTMLDRETLDPVFERYGDFCMAAELDIVRSYNEERPELAAAPLSEVETLHFWGNFYSYSCVFSVYTDDRDLIAKLTAAIRANKATVAYKQAKDERAEYDRYRAKREREQRRSLSMRGRR